MLSLETRPQSYDPSDDEALLTSAEFGVSVIVALVVFCFSNSLTRLVITRRFPKIRTLVLLLVSLLVHIFVAHVSLRLSTSWFLGLAPFLSLPSSSSSIPSFVWPDTHPFIRDWIVDSDILPLPYNASELNITLTPSDLCNVTTDGEKL